MCEICHSTTGHAPRCPYYEGSSEREPTGSTCVICGDPIYGSAKGAKVPRLMLHAYSLTFTHPRTGERLTFTAELPEEFRRGMKSHGVVL